MTCNCSDQSRDGSFPLLLAHLPTCPAFGRDLADLLTALCRGIEAWAADEDGVHPECWEAYRRAKVAIGELVKESQVCDGPEIC